MSEQCACHGGATFFCPNALVGASWWRRLFGRVGPWLLLGVFWAIYLVPPLRWLCEPPERPD